MKKLISLAAGVQRNALLCCAAAVLLSACGAGVSDPVNGLPSQTAAELTGSAAQPAANNAGATLYGADATPRLADASMVATSAAPAPAPLTATASPAPAAATAPTTSAASNIDPAYDSNPQSARTAGFSDQAETPVDAAQDTAPAACDAGTCQL